MFPDTAERYVNPEDEEISNYWPLQAAINWSFHQEAVHCRHNQRYLGLPMRLSEDDTLHHILKPVKAKIAQKLQISKATANKIRSQMNGMELNQWVAANAIMIQHVRELYA
jgi:hypothetical protein